MLNTYHFQVGSQHVDKRFATGANARKFAQKEANRTGKGVRYGRKRADGKLHSVMLVRPKKPKSNPKKPKKPGGRWMKVKAVRVRRSGGATILDVKR